jgi:hypothetical protein
MSAMDERPTSDTDDAEGDETVAGDAPALVAPESVGERPEADVLEQSAVVETEQTVRRPTVRDDVPIADAWEQSIEEPLDEDRA